jgi:hypothetical protein
MGLLNPQIREVKEMMYEFTEPYIVDDSKYRDAFGCETTDPSTAIDEIIT